MRKSIKTVSGLLGLVLMMILTAIFIFVPSVKADNVEGYVALDSSDPIVFSGNQIEYRGKTVTLGPKDIYVDGSLTQETAEQYPYVYNSITEALSDTALTDGTEEDPMTVYVAPYVYWIDDPEATDVVKKTDGYGVPYGKVVNADWLHIQGLTSNPYNVVFAGNRGQSNGADGNYTMFRFNGNGLTLKNITIGNYCSVDLDYPLKPELSHAKRTSTITQAQLADVSGDKVYAENCNFISRLNLVPASGGTRTLYKNCHFESTDDALNGTAVYLNCDFDFYGNRPFYSTYNTGAVLLNCQFNSRVLNVETEPYQYFTKEEGPVTVVDSSFTSNFSIPFGIGWTKYPSAQLRCYQYNITHNGNSIQIGASNAKETVDMTGKDVLNAYRVNYNGKVYYNTYNLLRGSDDWDPGNVKSVILAAGEQNGKDYASIPTMLKVKSDKDEIESGVTTAVISYQTFLFGGAEVSENADLSLSDEDKAYASLSKNNDGTYTLTGTNTLDDEKKVTVYASTTGGLEGAVEVSVKPTVLAAPGFIQKPVITSDGNGTLSVNYSLNADGHADQSLISWYRCSDKNGSNPILVAVSRDNVPMKNYKLTAGDIGYYMKAVVEPKSSRSNPGSGESAITGSAVIKSDVRQKELNIDFSNFPTSTQPLILPGFWTADCYRPADAKEFTTWNGNDDVDPWKYGETGNGSVGEGLYQGTQGARLMYTPLEGTYGDMSLTLTVDPAKTGGQGFGSAGQYMDIYIKFDTSGLNGYGLRIIRTKAASNAVTFVLVKYENGQSIPISDEVIASCFMTGCRITLKAEGNKLTAHVETPTPQLADQASSGYAHSVDLSADITPNSFGGIAIFHTGTTGTGGWQNTTMLHNLNVAWDNNQGISDLPADDESNQAQNEDGNSSVINIDTKNGSGEPEGSNEIVATSDNQNGSVFLFVCILSGAATAAAYMEVRKKKYRN